MYCFIKSKNTFETLSISAVFDYSIYLSIYDSVSTIIIKTPNASISAGDFVYIDGGIFFGVINSIEPDYGRTTLQCGQPVTLFSRNMFYTDQSFQYLEDYLAKLITDNFINCSDPFYAIPYLSVQATTHTTATMKPDLDENNIYSIMSYASKMRRLYNIFLEWTISRNSINVTIASRTMSQKNIDFTNPSYKILTQDFSDSSISKITSYCVENSQYQDWVLQNDGTITNTISNTNRKYGEWVPLVVQNAADVTDSVRDLFFQTEYSHNIEFSAYKRSGFSLYDRLLIKLNGSIFSSYISGIKFQKNSNASTITCGELQTVYPYLNRL